MQLAVYYKQLAVYYKQLAVYETLYSRDAFFNFEKGNVDRVILVNSPIKTKIDAENITYTAYMLDKIRQPSLTEFTC